ncbi:MAG: NAD(P)-dependent alcohol dehydrogenase [Xanthomonadales bacterium]|nr:NAD(P)-dependent alcohol dehydrogenase [Xanthomonadales bacterium]
MARRRRRVLRSLLGLLVLAIAGMAVALRYESPCAPPSAASGENTMLAARQVCYGPPSQLVIASVPRPVAGPGELLVRVHAAGVNPLDWHSLYGQPYFMRLSSGIGRQSDPRTGVDFAGTVEAVGDGVERFRPGDAVFGVRNGAFAEYLVVAADRNVVHKPHGIGFEAAAAVPIAALTALQAVRDAGRLQPGQRVLVNGASGGVGTFAVQIAKALGGHVTGVSSGRNVALVQALGADAVIDYGREDFTRGGRRYDLIVDNVGNHDLAALRRALHEDGTVVMVTGPKSNRWLGPLSRMLWARLSAPFVSQAQVSLLASSNPADLATLRDMLADGRLRPVIDRRFALSEVPAAIDWQGQGRSRGKNIVVMIPDPPAPAP